MMLMFKNYENDTVLISEKHRKLHLFDARYAYRDCTFSPCWPLAGGGGTGGFKTLAIHTFDGASRPVFF